MEVDLKIHKILIQNVHRGGHRVVRTARTVKEIVEWVEETEKEVIQDRIEDAVYQVFNK
jgi:hypothetical protein